MTVRATAWWEMDWKFNTLKIPGKKACTKHFHHLDKSQSWFFMQSHRQLWWDQHQNINRLLGTAWSKSSIPNITLLNHNRSCGLLNSLISFFSPNWLLALCLYSKAKPISSAQPYESITGKLGKEHMVCPPWMPFVPLLLQSFNYLVCFGVSHHNPTPLLLMPAALYVIGVDTGWHWKYHIPIALKKSKHLLLGIGTTHVLQVIHRATMCVLIWLDRLTWGLVT